MIIKKFLAIPAALALVAFMGFGTAHAQVSPRVAIQLLNSGLTSPIRASDEDAVVARLVLDTTGSSEAVRISSLPFILSTGNGAQASNLNNCRVFNENNMDDELNSGRSLNNGLNTISLDSQLTLQAGTVTTLSLLCDVDEDLEAGGTFTFSMNTANLSAVGVTTGLPAVVTVRGATNPPVVVPPPTNIPGLPTTGAGGEAAGNIVFILGSLVAAGLGLTLMRKGNSERA